MMTFALPLLLAAATIQQPDTNRFLPDTVKINEVTIVGEVPKVFCLPMVSVDKKTIDASPFFTPADALKRKTGIAIARDGIWGTSVNVRGLSEQRLLFMVDGDRIQTATDVAGALSTIDLSGVEKIEVIKGAGSVLYGTGAMGGIVNFVSERPAYSPIPKASGKISSGFNTVNNLWTNNANFNFSTQQWYLALHGSFRTAQNTQTPNGEMNGSQFHDASWGLKGGIKYAANEEFLVNYDHVEGWDIGIPGGNTFPATSAIRYKDIKRNQLSGEYIITDINDVLTEISLKAYTQNISRNVENILKPQSTAFPKTKILPGSTNSTSGVKLNSNWLITEKQKLTLGAEGWMRKSETARLKIVTASDTLYTVIGEQPTPNARMLNLGIFGHYSFKVIPEKLKINAGVRLDYIRTSNDTAFNPVFTYTVVNGVRKDPKTLNRSVLFAAAKEPDFAYAAHADLVYTPGCNQTLALSLSSSYRAASIEERFKFIDQGTNVPLKVGNSKLDPERGYFANLSYGLTSKDLKIQFDVFTNYLTDLIAEQEGYYIGRKALIYGNIDNALFVGAELEGSWNISKCLSLLANAGYTRARDLDNDSPLPQIPPMSGFASLNYHPGKYAEATFSTEWATDKTEAAPGEPATKGHTIYNFDVHSTPIQLIGIQLQLFGGIANLLDTAYYNHLTSVRNGGALYAEPGRNIYAKAKLIF